MKVLIADDDRVLTRMLGAEFRKRGWDVVEAFDAMQAFMFTKRTPQPDIVVLDLGMPGGNGFTVLERLGDSASTSTIPVLVITARKDDSAAERALEMGATRFRRKPVEPALLVDEVETMVAGAPG